jgi:GNAT superfamily N-acetyltransferase
VSDAVVWLRAAFESLQVRLPLVEELPAHAVPLSDEIFDSLREGYLGFDEWWRIKCVAEHRPCWVVSIGGEIAGLVVRKKETHAQAGTHHPGPKILKVCTFKVKPKFRGEKLGELLLKQILWFAQRNAFDLVYLTTFDSQAVLIDVLRYYGFAMTGTNGLGEQIYEKALPRDQLDQRQSVRSGPSKLPALHRKVTSDSILHPDTERILRYLVPGARWQGAKAAVGFIRGIEP